MRTDIFVILGTNVKGYKDKVKKKDEYLIRIQQFF